MDYAAHLGEQPVIDPTASVIESRLGRYTEVLERSRLVRSELGDYSYLMEDCQVVFSRIGKFANLASNCRLNPSNHPMWRPSLHHFTYRSAKYGLGPDDPEVFAWRRQNQVVVGNDTWIGHGASLQPGVTVGDGAVVGTGAVVTKDVAPYTVVVGVPARPLRERFPRAIAERLQALAWWDWPHEKLKEALPDFRHLKVAAFLEKYGA